MAGDLAARSTEQVARLSSWKRDVMKHQNSAFPKRRDFWVSDLVLLLLIGYTLILTVQCMMLLHIFTESGTADGRTPKCRFLACKAKLCPLIPEFAATNCILPHCPSAPHLKKIPLTSLDGFSKASPSQIDFAVLHGGAQH